MGTSPRLGRCSTRIPVIAAEWRDSAGPIADALRAHPVVMLQGHGAYARGTDIWDALRYTSALEEAAQILLLRQRR